MSQINEKPKSSTLWIWFHRKFLASSSVGSLFDNQKEPRLCCSSFWIKFQPSRSATLLKETQTQVSSCEYCKIFNFEEHMPTATFGQYFCFMKTYSWFWLLSFIVKIWPRVQWNVNITKIQSNIKLSRRILFSRKFLNLYI